jgi:hypothetical protein
VARRRSLVLAVSVMTLLLLSALLWWRVVTAMQASSCSARLPGNAVCYRSQIPSQLLDSAPFRVTEPRQVVASVTGLPLRGAYVARLGSDDPTVGHPLGPLMMVEYVFGTVSPSSGARGTSSSYVTVLEDGNVWPTQRGLFSGNGEYDEEVVFDDRRMEISVTTNGPRAWETRLVHRISVVIRSEPPRAAPRLSLYVDAPSASLSVGSAVSFFVLNNTIAARKPAAFDLTLQGQWAKPQVRSPYEGGACGGDNIPTLSQRSGSLWDLNFGDCRQVEIVVTPTLPGLHRISIRTYRLAIGRNGIAIPGKRWLVPHGGFVWSGVAY